MAHSRLSAFMPFGLSIRIKRGQRSAYPTTQRQISIFAHICCDPTPNGATFVIDRKNSLPK